MTNILHIQRIKGDTRRRIFHILSKTSPSGVDITSWTNFELLIDTLEFPPDNTTVVETIAGIVVDATTGRVGFTFSGTLPQGNYFYKARAVDDNSEITTFVRGNFVVL